MNRTATLILATVAVIGLLGCRGGGKHMDAYTQLIQAKVDAFAEVPLTSNIDSLTDKEKAMLPILLRAAQVMDDLFWQQAYGDKDSLLNALPNDTQRAYALINYGPWERLNGNAPFAKELAGAKPLGANFYPHDMTKEEFERFADSTKTSLYTVILRDTVNKKRLHSVPYHEVYKDKLEEASALLRQAAELAEDQGLKNYLTLRAEALVTSNYLPSDLAWMDMKHNRLDIVIGPIENYEDQLYGYKTSFESFVLIKDLAWSRRLAHYMELLPALQESLPVDSAYKQEKPGSDSDLGVYDVVYYAGDCNAGSKTIAINLPNDPRVHVEKGSRKLQLKNAMAYKFEKIMKPISDVLIAPAQRKHVTNKAFFENTMFHEVAHGLGVKQTLAGTGSVQDALKETYNSLEEGKADVLGIYMIEQLIAMGELPDYDIMDSYVTFLAGIFRSVRFGAASAHGRANMVRFHYFQARGAFTRDAATGFYTVNQEKMHEAVSALSHDLLVLQGNGDYEGAKAMLATQGTIDDVLAEDLARIAAANIPIDLRYRQGAEQLGLQPYQGQ